MQLYKGKYRKLDIDENRKKAIMFFLMYKIEDVRDQKGRLKKNLFHCACKDGHLGLAKLLRQRGANIYAEDEEGNNALDLAYGEKLINYLKSLGLTGK